MVLGLLNTPAIFPLPKVFFQSTYLGLITYLSVWMTLAYLLTGCFLYITTSYPCPSKKCFFFESTPSSLIFFSNILPMPVKVWFRNWLRVCIPNQLQRNTRFKAIMQDAKQKLAVAGFVTLWARILPGMLESDIKVPVQDLVVLLPVQVPVNALGKAVKNG